MKLVTFILCVFSFSALATGNTQLVCNNSVVGNGVQHISVTGVPGSYTVTVVTGLGTFSQALNQQSSIVKLDAPPYVVSSIDKMVNPPWMIGQIYMPSDPAVGTVIKLDSDNFRLGQLDGFTCTAN